MCLTKASFDFMDRRDSQEAKQLKSDADKLLSLLNYDSPAESTLVYLKARKAYRDFLYQDSQTFDKSLDLIKEVSNE